MNVQPAPVPSVESDPQRAAALRALGSADQFLAAAERLNPGIAAQLRTGQADAPLAELARLLQGLGSLAQMAVDLQRVMAATPGRGAAIDLRDLSEVLRQIVAAEEAGRWGQLADVLDQQLQSRLGIWRSAFADLASRL